MSTLLQKMREKQKAKAAALQKEQGRTPEDSPTARQIGGVTGKAEDTGLVQKAKQHMSSAEEQLTKDRDSGLFDLHNKVSEEIPVDTFMENFRDLRWAQLAKTPELPKLLTSINTNIRKYPELAHALTDEQLHVVVSSTLHVAGAKQASASGAKGVSKKEVVRKNSQLSLDDF